MGCFIIVSWVESCCLISFPEQNDLILLIFSQSTNVLCSPWSPSLWYLGSLEISPVKLANSANSASLLCHHHNYNLQYQILPNMLIAWLKTNEKLIETQTSNFSIKYMYLKTLSNFYSFSKLWYLRRCWKTNKKYVVTNCFHPVCIRILYSMFALYLSV